MQLSVDYCCEVLLHLSETTACLVTLNMVLSTIDAAKQHRCLLASVSLVKGGADDGT